MLSIRPAQLEAFALARVAAHLRRRWPARLTDAAARAVAAEAVTLAATLALDDPATDTLAECIVVFGPPPWDASWAGVLSAAGLPAPLRSARFAEAAREALMREAPR